MQQRFAVLVLAAAVLAGGCSREPAAEPQAPAGVAVTVASARMEAIRDVVSAAGMIVPSIGADFTVTAPELARILEIPKGEGEVVAQNDVLVKLEIPSLIQELANREVELSEATTRVAKAKQELARLQILYDKGLLPRVQYEAARADVNSAESALSHATNLMAAVKAQEDRAVIRARFGGLIVKVWRAAGDTVTGGANDPILRIIDPSRVQVSILLSIAEVARVTPGLKARVQTGGGAPLEAIVATRTTPADASAMTVDVRLNTTVPLALPVDTPVQVEITVDERASALVIPVGALLRDGSGSFVYVAGDDNKAHRKNVSVGLSTRTIAEITSGLSAGDRVILTGLADVNDGVDILIGRGGASGG
ncbi:MAG TPA: efflux RND transporter periplasmic adaptor subunit [Vicinamibacterales bacterium]|nr:efflux RND transporter periplasmic adaptor subunit [Vicinamibacterales bacterium]